MFLLQWRSKVQGEMLFLLEARQPFRPYGWCSEGLASLLCMLYMTVRVAAYYPLYDKILNWCRTTGLVWTQILETMLHLEVVRLVFLVWSETSAVHKPCSMIPMILLNARRWWPSILFSDCGCQCFLTSCSCLWIVYLSPEALCWVLYTIRIVPYHPGTHQNREYYVDRIFYSVILPGQMTYCFPVN